MSYDDDDDDDDDALNLSIPEFQYSVKCSFSHVLFPCILFPCILPDHWNLERPDSDVQYAGMTLAARQIGSIRLFLGSAVLKDTKRDEDVCVHYLRRDRNVYFCSQPFPEVRRGSQARVLEPSPSCLYSCIAMATVSALYVYTSERERDRG